MRRVILLLACALLPGTTAAQNDCVTLPHSEGVLKSVSRYFLDDDLQQVREGWLPKLDSAAPRFVESDARACQRVMREVASVQRKAEDWQAFQATGYEFAVYRIGPYYAVVIRQVAPPGETRLARIPMLVFRVSDLGYVGTILV
jgi:hypothetical protein